MLQMLDPILQRRVGMKPFGHKIQFFFSSICMENQLFMIHHIAADLIVSNLIIAPELQSLHNRKSEICRKPVKQRGKTKVLILGACPF